MEPEGEKMGPAGKKEEKMGPAEKKMREFFFNFFLFLKIF